MNKLVLKLALLLLVAINVWAMEAAPQIYTYQYDSIGRILPNSKIRNLVDIQNYLQGKYGVTITQTTEKFDDANKSVINLMTIDVKTSKKIYDIFSGPAHESALIMELALNYLQPEMRRDMWPVDIIIVSINGQFLHTIDYDRTYPTVFTYATIRSVFDAMKIIPSGPGLK